MANVHPISSPDRNHPLDVRAALAGRELFVTGTTGFLGKVWLSHVLYTLGDDVGRITLLVRGADNAAARARMAGIAERSPAFRPLRERHGAALGAWLAERIHVVAGDVGVPKLGLDDATYSDLAARLDAVVHVAGLTDFDPDPRDAFAINVTGAKHVGELAAAADHARLIHISTCYVVGTRDGDIPEAVTPGIAPNGVTFDVDAEVAACVAIGDDEDRTKKSRLAAVRERALALGWPNVYTFSKGLAEHVLAGLGVPVTMVRPSIVECATDYPFAGWNEGINTTGPMMWLIKSWFRHFPSRPDNHFDMIPVDATARAMTLILAASLTDRAQPVYHLATSASNPMSIRRAVELNNLAVRRDLRGPHASRAQRFGQRFFDTVHVDADENHLFALPRVQRGARWLKGALGGVEARDVLPKQLGAAFGKRLDRGLETAGFLLEHADRSLGRLQKMLDLYRPFVHDHDWVFANDGVRQLDAALSDDQRAIFGWAADSIDWRHYYMDVLYPGLHMWCLPLLEGGEVPEDPAMVPPLSLTPAAAAAAKHTVRA